MSYYLLENGSDRYLLEDGSSLYLTEDSTIDWSSSGSCASVTSASGAALVNNPASGSGASVTQGAGAAKVDNLASAAGASVSSSSVAALVALIASGANESVSSAAGTGLTDNPASGSVEVVSQADAAALVDNVAFGSCESTTSITGTEQVGEAAETAQPEQPSGGIFWRWILTKVFRKGTVSVIGDASESHSGIVTVITSRSETVKVLGTVTGVLVGESVVSISHAEPVLGSNVMARKSFVRVDTGATVKVFGDASLVRSRSAAALSFKIQVPAIISAEGDNSTSAESDVSVIASGIVRVSGNSSRALHPINRLTSHAPSRTARMSGIVSVPKPKPPGLTWDDNQMDDVIAMKLLLDL